MLGAGTEFNDDAGNLVTEDGGQREGNGTSDDVEVGVAQAARGHLDEDFTGLGARRADGFDLKTLVVVAQDGRAHSVRNGGSFGAHGLHLVVVGCRVLRRSRTLS